MRRASRVVLPSVALGLVLTACASFPEQSGPAPTWQPQSRLTEQAGPQPNLPGGTDAGGSGGGPNGRSGPPTSIPPPQGCKDFDTAVIGTCLSPVSAVAALPGGATGLGAERSTGRVLTLQRDVDPKQIAKLDVDASGDGGLTGLVLSPTYREDQLVYAYITTASDNRVVRFAPGDSPKPVLTGIPKGARDNRGSLAVDHKGALLVATGDAGDPGAAADPNSLAGKLLRIDGAGKPAAGNPNPDSAVIASGLSAPGGVCTTLDGGTTWVTDQTGTGDQLYKVSPGKPVGAPAWTWPDKPGVAGCAAFSSMIMVATTHRPGVQNLALNKNGSFSGKPVQALDDSHGYGQIAAVDIVDEQHALIGTVNKDGGKPVSSDDRVVLIIRPQGSPTD
ncbi:PQQ-dependent sugar dehydrogenase [Kutzneria viridogrisea]|uniref:Glucose/Sorbosone dehydrogenase domain-containing protein n=2 Tax=Kutzneria TaxID=43356 RepID=W5WJP2_9PSEU|nr:PQQ-dependent sugar dehydrogenase [Kutzneria albida]AHI00787.1 hypothetical protein KALB_7429 [Kutzneria albida DSM 43870]MBA8926063.1 glucose/arabinose dehydrogenase [Kutzneria viridogrisea]